MILLSRSTVINVFIHIIIPPQKNSLNHFKVPLIFLSVCLIQDHSSIGTATIYKNNFHLTADIGLLIGNKECWNSGYGTEVFNCLLSYLFKFAGVRKVTAGTASINYGMIRTLQKCGMHLEAVKARQEIIGSSIVDMNYYARFLDE